MSTSPRLSTVSLTTLLVLSLTTSIAWTATKPSHPAHKATHKAPVSSLKVAPKAAETVTQTVQPIDLLKDPQLYLNKKVAFEGTFNSFSSVGLDYKKAMRSSKDFVSIIIRRPDVTDHTIPLAELKLIFPRKKSEDVMHLESGDKIKITGNVFSTALNEPWLDVSDIKVLHKVKTTKPKDCTTDDC